LIFKHAGKLSFARSGNLVETSGTEFAHHLWRGKKIYRGKASRDEIKIPQDTV